MQASQGVYFFREAHDSSLEKMWLWGWGKRGCDQTATVWNCFDQNNPHFHSTSLAQQCRGSIHLPKDSLSLQLFLGFLPGQKLFGRFYRHSSSILQSCSWGFIFVSVLQRCICFSVQACGEVVSGGGFLFLFAKRSASACVSLEAGRRGRWL